MEYLQVKRREVGYPEQGDSLRKVRGGRRVQRFQKTVSPCCKMRLLLSRADCPPDERLPVFKPGEMIGHDMSSFLPGKQHIRPVDDIVTENLRQMGAELEELHALGIVLKVRGQGFETRHCDKLRECIHDLPRHGIGLIDARSFFFRKHAIEELVQYSVGKGKGAVRADAVLEGELYGEPVFHALALNNDDFLFQWRRKRLNKDIGDPARELLKPVSGIESQTPHITTMTLPFPCTAAYTTKYTGTKGSLEILHAFRTFLQKVSSSKIFSQFPVP